LNSVRRELTEFIREPFRLRDLTGPYAGSLLVENVLQFHRKDLPVLIELLSADIRH